MTGQPPMGASPIAVPSGNPGQNAQALSQMREAVRLLETMLPQLPTGSEPHKAALSAITNLAKHVPASAEIPGVQQTTLRNLQQSSQQSAPLQALMRSLGGAGAGAGGSPGAPGAPPAPQPSPPAV